MTTRRSPCTVPVSRKAPPRGCCRVMFLTQVASLSSHSSIRERICPPNRGPCFRTPSLAASENWDRLAGLYLSRDRRSFTTGNKRDEGKDYLAWKAQKHVWRRRGPDKRDKVKDYWYPPKSLLQKVSSVSFAEEASSSSQSRQLAWGTEIIRPVIESFVWSSQHVCMFM